MTAVLGTITIHHGGPTNASNDTVLVRFKAVAPRIYSWTIRRTAVLYSWLIASISGISNGHRELSICPIDSNGDSLVFGSLFCISEYM